MAKPNPVLENAQLRIEFDAERNYCPTRLVDARAPHDELLTLGRAHYKTTGDEFIAETGADHTFGLESDEISPERVMVRAKSPHFRLTKEFALETGEPWLRVRYTLEATGEPVQSSGMRLHVPDWSYGTGIENPLDVDIVDFSFGRILPGGHEAPPFFTFWLQGRTNGFILWTQNKVAMRRMVPRDEALGGVHPSIDCGSAGLLDDPWDQTYFAQPCTWEFYLWPVRGAEWGAARERLAAMKFPSWDPAAIVFPAAPAAGTAPAAFFSAADIARLNPEVVCTDGAPGKWWHITNEAGASVLYAQDPHAAPPLTIPHDLQGEFTVTIDALGSSGAMLRPHDTRYPVPLIQSNMHDDTPFYNALTTPRPATALDAGTWTLQGGAVDIGACTNMYAQSVIGSITFEAAPPRVKPARKPFICGVADAPDVAGQDGRPTDTPYRGNVAEHARMGFSRVYWRADGQCCDFHTKVGTVRYPVRRTHSVFNPATMPYGLALREYDLLTAAVETGHEHGIEVYGYMRINGFNGNVVPKFFLDHPELRDEREIGGPSPRMCFYLPEFRDWKVEIAREVVRHGVDGLLIDTTRTPQMVEYHPRVVQAYRDKFGKEPPRNWQRGYVSYGVHELETGPEWIEWWKFRADGFTQFGRDLRRMCAEEGKPNLPIHVTVRPLMALYDGFDFAAWADEKLIDLLQVWPHIDTYIVPQEIFDVARGRVPVRCLVTAFEGEERQARRMHEVMHDERYEGLTIYESNSAVWMPYLRGVMNSLMAQG